MKILIVDDSTQIREDFKKLLEDFVELTIIEAEEGLIGLEVLKENRDKWFNSDLNYKKILDESLNIRLINKIVESPFKNN